MSFDLIETTVANAILLRASYDNEPVDLNLLTDLQKYEEYESKQRASLTLDSLLKEPLGKYQFKVFLRTMNAEARIDLVREIQEYQKRKPKDRVSKSKYIFTKFLTRSVGDPTFYDLVVSHHTPAKSMAVDFRDDDDDEMKEAALNEAVNAARENSRSDSRSRSKSVSEQAGKSGPSPKNALLSPPRLLTPNSPGKSASDTNGDENKSTLSLNIVPEEPDGHNSPDQVQSPDAEANHYVRRASSPNMPSPLQDGDEPIRNRNDSAYDPPRFINPHDRKSNPSENDTEDLEHHNKAPESSAVSNPSGALGGSEKSSEMPTVNSDKVTSGASSVAPKQDKSTADGDELLLAKSSELKSSDFVDEKMLGEEDYREENSEDEDLKKEGILDLGIEESTIQTVYQRWREGIKRRKIPSDLFDGMLSTLQDQLQNQDFVHFLSSSEYKTFIQLKHYCETTQVTYADFQIFRVLGKGAFGAVHAVRKVDTKKIYAMKEMEKRKVKYYNSEKMCSTERNVLQSLSSPFALNLKYAFTNEESLFLVMDICQGGDLQYHLSEAKDNCFDEARTKFYAAELLLAVEHIHSLDYVYRDLKPGNILLDESGHLMLSDLGLVHKISSKKILNSLAGTAGYWAPEVMMRKAQTKAIDWWSFGVFLFKCLTGRRPKCACNKKEKEWCPFGTSDDHEQLAKAGSPMKFHLDLEAEKNLSPEAKDLISKLLDPNPVRRLGARGANEIKSHPFFNNLDWDKLEHREVKPPFLPRKGEVHAATLGEIGEGDANMAKYRKLQLTSEDEEFYKKWEYKSIAAIQEELVWTLRRNERVKRKQKHRNERKLLDGRLKRGCCSVQ
jgi:serine/threonine protein kinase